MRKTILSFMGIVMLTSCSSKTPEDLAKESCDCYKEAKSYSNTTKQLQKMDECFILVQSNLQKLQQQGIDNDWSTDQVSEATKRFDKIYNTCNGNTDSE